MEKSALRKGKEQDWGMVVLKSHLACNEFPASDPDGAEQGSVIKKKGGAVSDKSIVAGGTLISPRYLKLERPSVGNVQ